jgi:hypothetical protein
MTWLNAFQDPVTLCLCFVLYPMSVLKSPTWKIYTSLYFFMLFCFFCRLNNFLCLLLLSVNFNKYLPHEWHFLPLIFLTVFVFIIFTYVPKSQI